MKPGDFEQLCFNVISTIPSSACFLMLLINDTTRTRENFFWVNTAYAVLTFVESLFKWLNGNTQLLVINMLREIIANCENLLYKHDSAKSLDTFSRLTVCLIAYEFEFSCLTIHATLLSFLQECYLCIVAYSYWLDKKDEDNAALAAALVSVQANTGLQDHTQPMTTSQKAATTNSSSQTD